MTVLLFKDALDFGDFCSVKFVFETITVIGTVIHHH